MFDVEGIQLNLERQTVDVAKVHSADARFDVWMDSAGVLNYQTLFTPVGGGGAEPKSAPAKTEADEPAKPWSIAVGEVALRNYGADFEDRTLERPGRVAVETMNLTVKDIQIPFKKPLPIDLSMKLNETGSIGVKGNVAVEPLQADVEAKLEHIEIRPFQPYLDRFLNADVLDGAIDLNGKAYFVKDHVNEPLLRFQGNLAVNQLAIADRNSFDEVAAWKALNVNQIALDVEPTAVKIGEVIWQEPSVQIAVEADGQLNVSRLAKSPAPHDPPMSPKRLEATNHTPRLQNRCPWRSIRSRWQSYPRRFRTYPSSRESGRVSQSLGALLKACRPSSSRKRMSTWQAKSAERLRSKS